jgi:outer membrane lipoprotein-sorting protein
MNMKLTRRTFAATAASAAALALAPGAAHAFVENQDQVLADVQAYLNGITTLDSRFVQLNQDGTVMTGEFQLKRPSFARFAYDDPPTLLVARGQKYMFWDAEMGQFYEGPVSTTPASVLLHENIDLNEVTNVLDVSRSKGMLMVTLEPADQPGSGLLTLAFEEDPMRLRQWFVRDAQGYMTRITLVEVAFDVDIDNDLFDVDHLDLIRPE